MKSIYGMDRLLRRPMVPHSQIIDCLEIVGINEKVGRLLAESMKSWQVELTSEEEHLREVDIS